MIVVVGLNNDTAPVAAREALAFTKETLPAALARARERAVTAELASTCSTQGTCFKASI